MDETRTNTGGLIINIKFMIDVCLIVGEYYTVTQWLEVALSPGHCQVFVVYSNEKREGLVKLTYHTSDVGWK